MAKKGRPDVVKLDPVKFEQAWHRAVQAADAPDVIPIEVAKSIAIDMGDEGLQQVKFTNNPVVRMMASIKRFYEPDLLEATAASMRLFALMNLCVPGKIGPFFDPERGIHQAAIRAAAEAKWIWLHGGQFDFEDFRKRTLAWNRKLIREEEAKPSPEGAR